MNGTCERCGRDEYLAIDPATGETGFCLTCKSTLADWAERGI